MGQSIAVTVSSSFFFWTLSQLSVTVSGSDVCIYTDDFDLFPMYKTCQWGCCGHYRVADPCCSAPIGLIVGCVVGVVVLLAALCLVVCCCCFNQRRPVMGRVVRYPGSRGNAQNHSSGSRGQRDPSLSTICTPQSPGVFQPPPSYEEVMIGEINHAYKPE